MFDSAAQLLDKSRLIRFDEQVVGEASLADLELYSPGALANTMTVESLPLRQASRNETITSLLAPCPVPADIAGLETSRSTMMDRRGEGVAIILERSVRLSGRRPVYELPDESELKLTIFAADGGTAGSPT
jgi:predicted HTH transcriptional regulator